MNEIAYKKLKTLKYQSKQKLKFGLRKPIFFMFTNAAAFSLRRYSQTSPQVLLKCLFILENDDIIDESWIVWHRGHNLISLSLSFFLSHL